MPKKILSLDIGSSTVKMAEWVLRKDSGLELARYGVRAIGLDPENEASRMDFTGAAISELMADLDVRAGKVLLSISGQNVFSRYVKLPPVSGDKVSQIVEYEAKQNVPYPLEEVVWDKQIFAAPGVGEDMDVLLAAIKKDLLDQITETVHACGLETELVDISVASIYNTVRYNYPDLEGCTMVLDMGARTTNLIFMEGDQLFSRSIPAAGNNITQQIAKDFELDYFEAEQLKEEVSMVALGGAYEPLKDPQADRVTKCIRGVMTRMHADINRSISFYRSQQNGNAPSRVLLTGGSSIMNYLALFLQEKLSVPVEILNPLQEIAVSNKIPEEQIKGQIQYLSEVVGTALREAQDCEIQMDLLPPGLVRERELQKKQPWFVAAAALAVAAGGIWLMYESKVSAFYEGRKQTLQQEVSQLEKYGRDIKKEYADSLAVKANSDTLAAVVNSREATSNVLDAIFENAPDKVSLIQVRVVPNSNGKRFEIYGLLFDNDFQREDGGLDVARINDYEAALAQTGLFEMGDNATKFSQYPVRLSNDDDNAMRKHVQWFKLDAKLKGALPQ